MGQTQNFSSDTTAHSKQGSQARTNRFSPWVNAKVGTKWETKSHNKSSEMKTGLNYWFILGGNVTKRVQFYLM